MDLIKANYDNPARRLFSATVRLDGDDIDLIRFALLLLAKDPCGGEHSAPAMALYTEFIEKC